MDGAIRLATIQGQAGLQQGGADTAGVRRQGVTQGGRRALVVAQAQGLLGQFAVIMGHRHAHGLAEEALQAVGGLQTVTPVLLLLIDVDQAQEGAPPLVTKLGQFLEQALGAVEEPCAHVVQRQLLQGQGAQGLGQVLAGHEPLMDADRPIHLPPPPEEAPQGQLHLGGLAVHLRQLDEDIDRLVGLVVEQVIEATEIGRVWRAAPARPLGTAQGRPPAGGGGQGQEQQEPFTHDGEGSRAGYRVGDSRGYHSSPRPGGTCRGRPPAQLGSLLIDEDSPGHLPVSWV